MEVSVMAESAKPELAYVPLADVVPPASNVRTVFDEERIQQLARSIRAHGVLTPLRLRRIGAHHRLEVVAGERRYRAALLADLTEIPAVIEEAATDITDEARRVSEQITENDERVDLTAAERMGGVQQLLELGLTDDQVAEQLVSEPSQVAAMRRILSLPAEARTLIEEGALDLEEAAEIGSCEDGEVVAAALRLIHDGYNPSAALHSAEDSVTRGRVVDEARAKLVKAGVPEVHPPEHGYFPPGSKTRELGKGYDKLHVPVARHRKQLCHAAYISRWARSLREAIVYVCTDVTRHAADPEAGVPAKFLAPPEDVKLERAARRVQKKAWRESHEPRRQALAQHLQPLDHDTATARLAGAIFAPDDMNADTALLATELLGDRLGDGDAALRTLDALFSSGDASRQVRVAVAWLAARAELAMAKEHGDWREHENVRAHFALLIALGYEPNDGERAHLERAFSLTALERPEILPERRWDTESATDEADEGEADQLECATTPEAETEEPDSTDAADGGEAALAAAVQ
jgi:ParB/RepB/Spo0J family partition protein